MVETMTSDRELLHAFVTARDERAFAVLAKRHQSMMHAVALRICGDSQDAKDAMQRALIAFARRAGEIRVNEGGVGPWLHRATTLEAMAVRRQIVKQSIREQEAMEQRQLIAGGMPSEVAAELDQAINQLPPKDRSVIVLHFLESLTFRSIAQKHGGTEAAWQKRGVRALEKLSVTLKRRGVVATGTALGGWLVASPAEGALSSGTVSSMLNEALRQPSVASAGTQTTATTLLIMKMKTTLALCFAGGAVISFGLSDRMAPAPGGGSAVGVDDYRSHRNDRGMRNEAGFNLEQIANAIEFYDSAEGDTKQLESRLRALMFSVPQDHLVSVRKLFDDVKNPKRFDDITACFYARWAELDPEAAWLAALDEKDYLYEARRGVMVTWLNMDMESALTAMMKNRSDEEDLLVLDEFVKIKVQHQPREAAKLMDRLAELWPRADRRLFEDVARTWAYNDPDPAGEWVATYWDRDIRNEFLKRFSWRVGHKDYRAGLRMANRIDDPPLRQRARCSAIKWWSGGNGWWAVTPGKGDPEIDFAANGFPSDWNAMEISAFAGSATRVNYSYYDKVLAVAKNEEQRQAIYEGVIEASSYHNPAAATHAVEQVDPSFAAGKEGRTALSALILRWSERDAKAASEWLNSQPSNPKTTVMREALEKHGKQSK